MPEILLINPKIRNAEYFWPPLGLAYIASYLEKYSFKVKIIDANALRIEDEKIIETIENEPIIVGITAMTPYINSAWRIAQTIKQKFPKTLIILGGHHPSVLPEESLKEEFIDIIVIGEGEETMKELAMAIINKSLSIDQIKGIVYKAGSNEIKYTQPRSLIENLNELPLPAWHLLPFPKKYMPSAYKKLPVATIFTSRGCPYGCTFCHAGILGKRFRGRSPENIISEIESLIKYYGIKEFHIADDNFTLDANRVMKFCDLLIKKNLNLPWACVGGIRVNTVNQHPELIEKMTKAGFYRTTIGIESGNQQILNNIQKGITLKQVKEAVKILRKNKIFFGGFFMIGNYGENEKTVADTIRFAKSLPLNYAQIMITTPYPGTKLYEQVMKEGRFLTHNWDDFGLFTGAVFEWDNLSKAKIDKLYRKAYLKYYFSPWFLLRSLLKFKLSNWKIYVNGAFILFKSLMRYKNI